MGTQCSIEGCQGLARRRGWCDRHYQRWRAHEDPEITKMPTLGMSLADRLWAQVDRSGGPDACWPWLGGAHQPFGYGLVWDPDLHRADGAHRVAYRVAIGPIPVGQAVAHSCDNPPCCNPAHLQAMPLAQNTADMWARGRQSKNRAGGERNGAARLTEADVRAIRATPRARGSIAAMARLYGVNRTTIRKVLSGRHWSHVS